MGPGACLEVVLSGMVAVLAVGAKASCLDSQFYSLSPLTFLLPKLQGWFVPSALAGVP